MNKKEYKIIKKVRDSLVNDFQYHSKRFTQKQYIINDENIDLLNDLLKKKDKVI